MTLELRFILVRLNYAWKYRCNYAAFLFVIVTHFFYITISLFIYAMYLHFFMTLELRYILVCLNYARKLRYKMINF